MRHARVGGQELRVQRPSGVFARKVPRFGRRDEELAEGGGVHGEVVDGFVVLRGPALGAVVAGYGQHGEDGVRVGCGDVFALLEDCVG